MPSRFREALSECCDGKLIVTVDVEGGCLTMHPLPDWEDVEQKILGLPSLSPIVRRLQRMVLGYATETQMDNNGRVAIPQLLRDEVNLDKKIMLVGLGRKFEIWSESVWSESYKGWVNEGPLNLEELPEAAQNLVL